MTRICTRARLVPFALCATGALALFLAGCRKEEAKPEIPASSPASYMNDTNFMGRLSADRRERQKLLSARTVIVGKMKAMIEAKKAELEVNISKLKTQIEDLNSEIKSVKEELQTQKDETEAVKEELAKKEKVVDQLKKLLSDLKNRDPGSGHQSAAGTNVTAGNKGKIVDINTQFMYAVIEFSDEAMKELLGPERTGILPQLEMGIRRKGFAGPAGEFVGRVRLRQSVAGKNLVIADVLGDWQQAEAMKGDDVFSE